MVSRLSHQHGPRLGAVGDAAGLLLRCERCTAVKLMPMFRALHLWGVRTHLRTIASDLVCDHCRAREVDVSVELKRLKIVGGSEFGLGED